MTQGAKDAMGIAITSLVFGILGLTCLGPIGGLVAVICGHVAMSRLSQTESTAGCGQGQALAGLIMGYIGIASAVIMIPLLMAIAIPSFVSARERAQEMACRNNLRQIEMVKDAAAVALGRESGDTLPAEELADFGFGDIGDCPKGGTYTINPVDVAPTCSVHGLGQE